MGTFFSLFWKEIAIGGLLLFIVAANHFYVDKIKLQRDLAQAKNETLTTILEEQSNKILEASERTKKVVESNMEDLDTKLDRLTDEQREHLNDLLNVEIPEDCGELNKFLIDMSKQLRWNNE